MTLVELHEVTITTLRGSQPLLRDVSFGLQPGEHVIVLGPSGSGKSSLIKTISGVIPHSMNVELSGEVRVARVETRETTVVERARVVGTLGQDPSASVCLATVEDEIALPLENLGIDRAEISGSIEAALAIVDATHLRHRRTADLSGGETQRVALAATLAMRPQVLLLDEPTSMLDPAGIRAVRNAIGAAASAHDAAVVLVEHRLDEFAGAAAAAGLPQRAIVLGADGQVMADGPTPEVMRDQAAALHAAGCWLPLDAELHALSGHAGGLTNPRVADWVRGLSTRVITTERSATAALTARDLSVGRGDHPVISNLNIELYPGEVVALLGPNGIGKTSLLLTLARLLPALSGQLTGPRPAMVFQNPEWQFLAHRVRDEIAVGLIAADEIVAEALRTHRLEHVAEQSPFRLSGGEQRRLSLAAMLAHNDRPVLLADEPTFGLDRRDAMVAAQTLRAAADAGRAVLCSTHDLRFAATIADRVVVLGQDPHRGGARVIAQGLTLEVLASPAVQMAANLVLPELLGFLIDHIGTGGQAVAVLRALAGWAPYDRIPQETL